MELSRGQVLAWRMRRQHLAARTGAAVTDVVARLGGVQAQVWSAAATAVALRQTTPDPEGIDRAFADRRLVKTWAMRGTLHLLRPEDAGAVLSLLAATGVWLKPSWERYVGVSARQVDELTEKVADVLDGAELTREQLVDALVADRRFAAMEERLRSGWGQVLKPLAWRGVLCHGPNQGSRVTFTSPASRYADWAAPPEPDEAAPAVIAAYLGAHGPATPEVFDRWLSQGRTSKPALRRWFADLGDRLTEVDVEGRRAVVLTEHADDLAGTAPATGVRLLGGFDQYVLGPGTSDDSLLDQEHRSAVSRTSGWISPVVLVDGRVVGVWDVTGADLVVSPFPGGPAIPPADLAEEAAHLARALGLDGLTPRLA